jgi:hypothetical protein
VCDDEGMNTEIALRAQELAKERTGEPVPFLLHVIDPQLCALLRYREASQERTPFRLKLFKVDPWSRVYDKVQYFYPFNG